MLEQMRELVPSPRPAAFGRQTPLIDIHNHDALLKGIGHRQSEPFVVGEILQAIDKSHPEPGRRMQQKEYQHGKSECDTRRVCGKLRPQIHHATYSLASVDLWLAASVTKSA